MTASINRPQDTSTASGFSGGLAVALKGSISAETEWRPTQATAITIGKGPWYLVVARLNYGQ